MKTSTLLRGSKFLPIEAKIPFVPDLPLKLRNHVSGKSNKNQEKGCLYEITVVLACLEKNNFENSMCTQEVNNFQDCYKTFLKNTKASKQDIMKGALTPGSRNLKYKQLNHLLAKYPQINEKKT